MKISIASFAAALVFSLFGAAPLSPAASQSAVPLRPGPASSISQQTTSQPRIITANGTAQVMAPPDEVILTLGVETSDLRMVAAKSKNDDIIQAVLKVTRDQGIDAKYVQTDYMNIEPRYNTAYDKREFLGYFIRKNVVITLKDVTKFEDLLSKVLEAGVNYVHGIEFRTTELRKYRDQARALAIKAASEKARAMAGELSQQVGQPLSISEGYNNWWYPWNSWWGSGYGGQMAQNVVQNAGGAQAGDGESSLSLGQISISASVTVNFELK